MKIYKLKTPYGNYKVRIETDTYRFGDSLMVELVDVEDNIPYARLTVCLEDDLGLPYFLAENEAFVDTNNCPWAEDFIQKNGLGKPTGMTARSGFCTYPRYKFNLDKLRA